MRLDGGVGVSRPARLARTTALALLTMLVLAQSAVAHSGGTYAAQSDGGLELDTPVLLAAGLLLALILVVVVVSIVRRGVRLLLVAAIALIVLLACGCVVAAVWSYLS